MRAQVDARTRPTRVDPGPAARRRPVAVTVNRDSPSSWVVLVAVMLAWAAGAGFGLLIGWAR